jgi:hypothetical protein
MSNQSRFSCSYCGNLHATQRALTQHLSKAVLCRAANLGAKKALNSSLHKPFLLPHSNITGGKSNVDLASVPNAPVRPWSEVPTGGAKLAPDRFQFNQNAAQHEDEFAVPEEDDTDLEDNEPQNEEKDQRTYNSIYKDYYSYVQEAKENVKMPNKYQVALDLMQILRRTDASLGTYNEVMAWHFRSTGKIQGHQKANKSPDFVSREALFRFLKRRYNRDVGYSIQTPVILPSCGQKANVVTNDTAKVLQSLLTDPRIQDNDYLFWGNDPFCPPPETLNFIEDLNSGLCYTATYKKLIKDPTKQVLLPTPLYIDGASTGQFASLQITAVKITLGIFTRLAREKGYMWRTLGYLPYVSDADSRGKRQLADSGHADGTKAYLEMLEDEGLLPEQDVKAAQDMHVMLEHVLADLVELQRTGFKWDLAYRGKLYKGIEFIPFVPFIKADTDEAERLCGKYTSRGQNVACLCRYCECPTEESSNQRANYRLKDPKRITKMIQKKDLEGLKAISQQFIQNAFYKVQFGLHNELGVHAACPLEMLHHILLGIFKTVRDVFNDSVGLSSKDLKEFTALATQYGALLNRQSERDMPKTAFYNGLNTSKLMANEYPGILLLILTVLKSGLGQTMLKKKPKWRQAGVIDDWVMLLETLLEWHAWLRQPQIKVEDVKRAEKKHRYLMYLIKKVANRTKGMGLNTAKFHGILHLCMDMLNYGTPLEVDTGANESHHKPAKKEAKKTQKRKATFDFQTANRLLEMELLALFQEELEGRPPWEYWEGYNHPSNAAYLPENDPEPEVGGLFFWCKHNPLNNEYFLKLPSNEQKGKKIAVEQDFVDFVGGLQELVGPQIGPIKVLTRHKRNGHIFRASPNFYGGTWRDWVIVDWGKNYGKLPNKLWGFVDLQELNENFRGEYGGLDRLGPNVYAIVESATYVNQPTEEEEDAWEGPLNTDMFTALELEADAMEEGYVTKIKFYLADVEAFVEPVAVVPDIGGKSNGYWMVKPRRDWANLFSKWLQVAHNEDDMSDSESDE